MYFIVSWYLSAVQNAFLVTPFLLQSLLKAPKVSSLSLNSIPYICPFSLGQSTFPILKWDPSMQRMGRRSASVLDRGVGSCCLGTFFCSSSVVHSAQATHQLEGPGQIENSSPLLSLFLRPEEKHWCWLPGKLNPNPSDSREKEVNEGVETKTQDVLWEASHRHGTWFSINVHVPRSCAHTNTCKRVYS